MTETGATEKFWVPTHDWRSTKISGHARSSQKFFILILFSVRGMDATP